MSIQNYKGSLGEFSYDNTEFSVCFDEMRGEYLHYEGNETDGSKIHIPKGVTNGSYMFEDSNIVSQPELPMGLKTMDYMFIGCKDMETAGRIPDTVTSTHSSYSYCVNLKNPADISDSVLRADFMYDGCKSLTDGGEFPRHLKSAVCMFANCPNLETVGEIPSSVRQSDFIFLNSDKVPDDLSDVITDDFEFDDDYSVEFSDISNDDIYRMSDLEQRELKSNTKDFVSQHREAYNTQCGMRPGKESRELDFDVNNPSSEYDNFDFK